VCLAGCILWCTYFHLLLQSARHVKLQLSESLYSQISSKSLGEVVDLLQSKKINLVTARKLLQEIISGNPESPSEVGGSTQNIVCVCVCVHMYGFFWGGGGDCS
jgi:Asp-tRNA(Asn)/Glu-tRNA(Gln) amidotransferase B subunit